MEAQEYVSKRTFDYTPEIKLSRGQIFIPAGVLNDEALERIGFFAPLKIKPSTTYECGECGVWFVGMAERDQHFMNTHGKRWSPVSDEPPKRVNPGEDVEAGPPGLGEEREVALQRHEDRVSPLHMDKTKASLESGAGTYEVKPGTESSRSNGRPLEQHELTRRTYNALKNADVNSLADLESMTERQLLSIKSFGRSSLKEIKGVLRENGMRLKRNGKKRRISAQARTA